MSVGALKRYPKDGTYRNIKIHNGNNNFYIMVYRVSGEYGDTY